MSPLDADPHQLVPTAGREYRREGATVGLRASMAAAFLMLPAWFCWRDSAVLAVLAHLIAAVGLGWVLADTLVRPERCRARVGALIAAMTALILIDVLWPYRGIMLVAADLRQGFALTGVGALIGIYGVLRRRHSAYWLLLALSVFTLGGLFDLVSTMTPKRTVYRLARSIVRGDPAAASALIRFSPAAPGLSAGNQFETPPSVPLVEPNTLVWLTADVTDGTATAVLYRPRRRWGYHAAFGDSQRLCLVRVPGGEWLVVVQRTTQHE